MIFRRGGREGKSDRIKTKERKIYRYIDRKRRREKYITLKGFLKRA